jgi:hypothetical protein
MVLYRPASQNLKNGWSWMKAERRHGMGLLTIIAICYGKRRKEMVREYLLFTRMLNLLTGTDPGADADEVEESSAPKDSDAWEDRKRVEVKPLDTKEFESLGLEPLHDLTRETLTQRFRM